MKSYDKIYYEIYALLSLELISAGYADGFVKAESPDWKNTLKNIGLEVARAENKHIGYTKKLVNDYLGKNRNDIPPKTVDDFLGYLSFQNEKLIKVSDSKGLVDGTRHITFAISAAEEKLILLNKSHYHIYQENSLFLFVTNEICDGDLDLFLEGLRNCSRKYRIRFDAVYLHDNVSLYKIQVKKGTVQKHVYIDDEINDLQKNAHVLRLADDWEEGVGFIDVFISCKDGL